MCRYSIATLMAAKHDYELQADGFTHLHLDHRHMGVGGDDSWSPSLHKVLSFCMLCKMTSCKVLLLLLLRLHELLSSNLCNCRSMLSCRESTPSLSCLHLCSELEAGTITWDHRMENFVLPQKNSGSEHFRKSLSSHHSSGQKICAFTQISVYNIWGFCLPLHYNHCLYVSIVVEPPCSQLQLTVISAQNSPASLCHTYKSTHMCFVLQTAQCTKSKTLIQQCTRV